MSLPGLSYEEMLKTKNFELDIIKYLYMELFIEKGIRGVIIQVVKRYAKANNC